MDKKQKNHFIANVLYYALSGIAIAVVAFLLFLAVGLIYYFITGEYITL